MTKQELASKIWAMADKMRSKIKANEYKDYILGFMFYKYLSDKEYDTLIKSGFSDEEISKMDEDILNYLKDNIGYAIEYNDLFSTWKAKGTDLTVKTVSEGLNHFNRNINPAQKSVFYNIFNTLQNGIDKLGDSSGSRSKAIRDIVDMIDSIPTGEKQGYDVIGYIYEYLIYKFATVAKDDGAFYTPHEVSSLIAMLIADACKDMKELKVYDPTSGSGSLLLNIGEEASKYIDKYNIKYYGQEKITETYHLTRMNLVMKGVPSQNITVRNGDTLEDDWPYFDENTEYYPLRVNAVVSNPPYSLHWEPENRTSDDILFVDASQNFEKGKNQNVLRACDIKRIFDAVVERKSIENFSKLVTYEQIKENDYNLNIPRYVSASREAVSYDFAALMNGTVLNEELDKYEGIWDEFKSLRGELFTDLGNGYSIYNDVDIKDTVFKNKDVSEFIADFKTRVDKLKDFITKRLVIDYRGEVLATKEDIVDKLFELVSDIAIIDKYDLYQLFMNNWVNIEIDTSIMGEYKSACRRVEPNMVIKKDTEVQNGYKGTIIPFDLIGNAYFTDEYTKLSTLLDERSALEAVIAETYDSLDDDVKQVIGKGDKFVEKSLRKYIKTDADDSNKESLQEVLQSMARIKAINKEVKDFELDMVEKIKHKIGHLSNKEVNDMLVKKWVEPLCSEISAITTQVINDFVKTLENIKAKYERPLRTINEELKSKDEELVGLLDMLVGSEIDMKAIEELKSVL